MSDVVFPEDGADMFIWNANNQLQDLMASQLKRPKKAYSEHLEVLP
jgi:hypothetical protein